MRAPLRGRLMVGRLTLDQVVKVRVLAPQPSKPPHGGFPVSDMATRIHRGQRRGQQQKRADSSGVWTKLQRNGPPVDVTFGLAR
jgi:hypothetical protein